MVFNSFRNLLFHPVLPNGVLKCTFIKCGRLQIKSKQAKIDYGIKFIICTTSVPSDRAPDWGELEAYISQSLTGLYLNPNITDTEEDAAKQSILPKVQSHRINYTMIGNGTFPDAYPIGSSTTNLAALPIPPNLAIR